MFLKQSIRLGLTGALVVVLAPTFGLTQPPPGGGPGGGGGGPGGGGRQNRRFDPGMIFDRIANGRTTVPIAEVTGRDPQGPQRMQDWAARNGITNGEVTREQFAQYMEERRAEWQANGGPGGGGGGRRRNGGQDGGPPQGPLPQAAPGMAPQAPPAGGGAAPAGGATDAAPALPSLPDEEERPIVHRPGKLPKGLPDWFAKLDTDNDGQVGLYEWKEAGRPIDEFRKLDRNGDGFITVEEALRSVKKTASASANAGGGTNRSGDDSAEESSSTRVAGPAAPPTDGNRADRPARRQGPSRQWNSGQGNRRRGNGNGNGNAPAGGGQDGDGNQAGNGNQGGNGN
jgi:hypothetical protein